MKSWYMDHTVREAIEIDHHPNNMETLVFVSASHGSILTSHSKTSQKITPDPLGYVDNTQSEAPAPMLSEDPT
jgi:hypothetical protein